MGEKDKPSRSLRAVQAAVVQANHAISSSLTYTHRQGASVAVVDPLGSAVSQLELTHPSQQEIKQEEKDLEFSFIEKQVHQQTPSRRESWGLRVLASLKKMVTGSAETEDNYVPQWATNIMLNRDDGDWADERER